jgi:hypothetical protein
VISVASRRARRRSCDDVSVISSHSRHGPGYAVRVKRLGWIALLAGCGFQGSAPAGPSDGSSAPIVDAAVPGDTATTPPPIDARVCFGNGLLKNLCLSVAPTGDRTLSSAINTDGPGTCTQVLAQTGSPTMAPELCVIAARTITVQGTVTVTGKRALVLIGADTVTVAASATLDASSARSPQHGGPGADPGACTKSGNGDNSDNGSGGGAGGSLATKGGNGGPGNLNGGPGNSAKGGTAGAAQPAPAVLLGGCPGGKGGDGQNNNGGAGGSGGGALYLIAGSSITITGDVFASGAGGDGTPNNNGFQQGGGGGGSGGMIGLEAPMIKIDGRIAANGAAGGGGGASTGGKPGSEGTTTSWNARAVAGGPGTGCGQQSQNLRIGSGAPGTAGTSTDNLDGGPGDCGGGGGGGGLGIVTTYGTVTGGTTVSPPATKH